MEATSISEKICPRCKGSKPADQFGRNRGNPDGLASYCLTCYREYHREHQAQGHKHQTATPSSKSSQTPPGASLRRPLMDVRQLTEKAQATRNWAHRIGAFLDLTTGHHGYFTTQEWCEYFEDRPTVWKKVQRRIFQLGEPLAVDEWGGGGYYWGARGDQAKTLAQVLKQIQTRIETASAMAEGILDSGEWPTVAPKVQAAMSRSRPGFTLRSIPRLLDGGDSPISGGFDRLLIEGPDDEPA